MSGTGEASGFRAPSRVEATFNRLLGALLGFGLGPGHMRLLGVRGRRSGRLHETPVDPVTVEGASYLVAPRGETQWVRNLRASGEAQLRRGKARETYKAEPLGRDAAAPVLKAYLNAYPAEVQRYFDVERDAPLPAFEAVAERHPVFRLTRSA